MERAAGRAAGNPCGFPVDGLFHATRRVERWTERDEGHAPHEGKRMSKRGKSPLEEIPGVGPSIALDLHELGLKEVADLRGRDPEELYERLCALRGGHIDRCVLYVFRCAVYYADHSSHDPELLKWWNWKDGKGGGR